MHMYANTYTWKVVYRNRYLCVNDLPTIFLFAEGNKSYKRVRRKWYLTDFIVHVKILWNKKYATDFLRKCKYIDSLSV